MSIAGITLLRSDELGQPDPSRRDSRDVIGIVGDLQARERFFERQLIFAYRHGSAGRLVHALAWLVHNCLAHPILGLFPCPASVKLHDRSADWLNQSPRSTSSSLPRIDNRRAWIVHNCLAHFAMGVAPFGPVFRAHDRSAERMKVEGWI